VRIAVRQLSERISRILADVRFDDAACDDARHEAIWALVASDADWEAVRDRMIVIL
jgi:hypothetical protein